MALQARLKHGNSYTLNRGRGGKSIVFRSKEWMTISESDREYLEENAKERVVVKQGSKVSTQFIAKFEYREGVESTEKGDSPRRARPRAKSSAA